MRRSLSASYPQSLPCLNGARTQSKPIKNVPTLKEMRPLSLPSLVNTMLELGPNAALRTDLHTLIQIRLQLKAACPAQRGTWHRSWTPRWVPAFCKMGQVAVQSSYMNSFCGHGEKYAKKASESSSQLRNIGLRVSRQALIEAGLCSLSSNTLACWAHIMPNGPRPRLHPPAPLSLQSGAPCPSAGRCLHSPAPGLAARHVQSQGWPRGSESRAKH